jgi:hypothetical protein
MKLARPQKIPTAIAAALAFTLAGFAIGLAHGAAPTGVPVKIELYQVLLGDHAQFDQRILRVGFGSDICALPETSQSPALDLRSLPRHFWGYLWTRDSAPIRNYTASARLFDTVLLL